MLKIEFRYYDKISCSRCRATDDSIRKSLRELKSAVKGSGADVSLKETRLPESKMHLSPSILINGKDIEIIVGEKKLKSNTCTDCCKMIGHSVQCRTFKYKGKNYDHIPKRMITDAIKRVEDDSSV